MNCNEQNDEPFDSYIFDPMNPVITKGGRNLGILKGARDQKDAEQREDVLIYSTEPLEKGIEIRELQIGQRSWGYDVMAWIKYNRQVSLRFQHRDSVYVRRIAGNRLISAYAPLAQHHPTVAVGEHIFGCH